MKLRPAFTRKAVSDSAARFFHSGRTQSPFLRPLSARLDLREHPAELFLGAAVLDQHEDVALRRPACYVDDGHVLQRKGHGLA
ncbi:MAG: hypothetical protein DMG23_02450 [Acidobacteria bacterium]|nr:MAG: hypothetical protein DMG23_02450 [Acidobacteriota bacterium]